MSTVTVTPSPSRPSPFREDCWSEDATRTLLDAWADRYLTLDRGNLRQHDWCEVADAVNHRHHGGLKNTNSRRRRTDIQCKHRIDTLKKRYKVEKSKSVEFGGGYFGAWPFFARLDNLIGTSIHTKKASMATRRLPGLDFMTPIPVAPRSATRKRPVKVVSPAEKISGDDKFFRLNLSAFADMAARLVDDDSDSSSKSPANHRKITPGLDFTSRIPVAPRSATVTLPSKVSSPPEMNSGDGDTCFPFNNFSAFVDMAARLADDDSDSSRSRPRSKSSACALPRRKRKNGSLDRNRNLGCADVLAEAMGKFGEIYERVEGAKQRQMVELEKQRMQFAKDLEVHRMKIYVDTQVQLEKMKRARRSHRADSYS